MNEHVDNFSHPLPSEVYGADYVRQITDERDRLEAEVERLNKIGTVENVQHLAKLLDEENDKCLAMQAEVERLKLSLKMIEWCANGGLGQTDAAFKDR